MLSTTGTECWIAVDYTPGPKTDNISVTVNSYILMEIMTISRTPTKPWTISANFISDILIRYTIRDSNICIH